MTSVKKSKLGVKRFTGRATSKSGVKRFTGRTTKTGVLISNLGTPKSFSSVDVGEYLSEFLMDPHVIQSPKWVRSLFVKGVIVPLRKKRTASKYKKIWSAEGSPLTVQTKKFSVALQKELGSDYKVTFAMRYGPPDFLKARDELKGCQRVIFFPQYPQYAVSTVETSLHHFYKYFPKEKSRVIPPYYKNPEFIRACARFLEPCLKTLDFDYLLMSFHGLPVSHIKKADFTGKHCLSRNSHKKSAVPDGDAFGANCCFRVPEDILRTCYRAQCFHSAGAIALASGLSEKDYGVSFQSRLGPGRWIGPPTEQIYNYLIGRGIGKLAVICPGFSVDGLETLEEIAIKGKRLFLEGGGKAFHFIPCLNDNFHWVQACAKMIKGIE